MRYLPTKLAYTAFCLAAAVGSGCGFSSHRADDGSPPGSSEIACYGPDGWQVCLEAAPAGEVALIGAFDTDAAAACLATTPVSWTASQSDACIVVGDGVSLSAVAVTGKRPLVVVAHRQITVSGLLDVGSHRSGTSGAGSPSSECKAFARNPGSGAGTTNAGSGGGAGGSFITRGGVGGRGDDGNQQSGQSAEPLVGAPERLRGGCAGQPAGGGKSTDGGAGGGAVYLISGGAIDLSSATIVATGAGGAGGISQRGGSGGGSGGMIVLFGTSITTTSKTLLLATGGGGGGGGGSAGDSEAEGEGGGGNPGRGGPPPPPPPPASASAVARGNDGFDPTAAIPVVAATGGNGGSQSEGNDGGDGGDGFPAISSAVDALNGDASAGGGGGGGGAGYLRTNRELGAATVSPAAVIVP